MKRRYSAANSTRGGEVGPRARGVGCAGVTRSGYRGERSAPVDPRRHSGSSPSLSWPWAPLKIGALHDLGFGLDQPLTEVFHERRPALLSGGLAGSRRTARDLVLEQRQP
jgi:hypothetical protein